MNKRILLITALSILIVATILFMYSKGETSANNLLDTCPIQKERYTIRGNSLYPLLKPGDNITLLRGYYDCHPVERDEIIVYNFSSYETPIIKIVKAVPGDRFFLEESDNLRYNILVNNKVLKNSEGVEYTLTEAAYNLLSLYVEDYNRTIPGDTYLILGNTVSGSLDSTRFGLVGKESILGKVAMT